MFSIGIFSKINMITTKTLRHYDEIGLLKPEYVDEFTGYRYYTSQQLPKLHKIITLKQMGLSLKQIKEVIDNPTAINTFLKLKEQDILNNIEEEKVKLLQIRSYLNSVKGEDYSMYDPIIKELPKVIVASMRQIIPNYGALFHLAPNVMAKEMERLGCVCAIPNYCFNIYHDCEYKELNVDVEICEAVTEMKEDTEILKFKTIEAVPTAVCVLHKGSYANLRTSYLYTFKWIEENKYEVIGNPRESYIDGVWNKEKEEDWLTEIQVPVRLKK
ncbi:DNA-binding transcriptional MerR regulator [Clostridium tetanomorphum]|uniref:MerR family transcriptional regulator n=1 Tax=Clostridium tetanomorphum TaxID=1553 RepID=A0A923EBB5_CLOTT|nr:MerR family transcriptional regulator [Clostridium tetanomorphum]KAJ53008.1 MerR family transcriptional regulator [Clostridium tetanomorphum DSM 665]MBC2398541.1 MerR family transcriptional regulator [Clostridium tetanomorphum]MBP1864951.1 DNA-binding transcriptional MerR regulator [Clostridium tetanomorphum]NRS83157.1 DNA-binding transcriptional MerR regulator [Clostridium tetanomorphum]NRZ98742.1 DNA-binding transcriptional MerR regulator [Clostridium tetanomorphum]